MYGLDDSEYARMRKSVMRCTAVSVFSIIVPVITFALLNTLSKGSGGGWTPVLILFSVLALALVLLMFFSLLGLLKAESLLKGEPEEYIFLNRGWFWVVMILATLVFSLLVFFLYHVSGYTKHIR